MTSEVHMVSVDEKEEQIELSSSEQKIFSMQTEVTVDKGMIVPMTLFIVSFSSTKAPSKMECLTKSMLTREVLPPSLIYFSFLEKHFHRQTQWIMFFPFPCQRKIYLWRQFFHPLQLSISRMRKNLNPLMRLNTMTS